jgi:hypothetical protein
MKEIAYLYNLDVDGDVGLILKWILHRLDVRG